MAVEPFSWPLVRFGASTLPFAGLLVEGHQFQAASCDTIIGPLKGITHVHHSGNAAAEKGLQFRSTPIASGERSKGRHRKGMSTRIKTLVFDKVREALVE